MTDTPDPDPIAPTDSTIALGFSQLPRVLFDLAAVLHEFSGRDLESQLQTFDIFVGIGSPTARREIAALLRRAASDMPDLATRWRVTAAAAAISGGGRATAHHTPTAAIEGGRTEQRTNAPKPGHHVEEAAFRAAIARTGATLDPEGPAPDGTGRIENWRAPDGRLVGWVYVLRFKDGNETGYCLSGEFLEHA